MAGCLRLQLNLGLYGSFGLRGDKGIHQHNQQWIELKANACGCDQAAIFSTKRRAITSTLFYFLSSLKNSEERQFSIPLSVLRSFNFHKTALFYRMRAE